MNTPTVYISAALLEVEYAATIRSELARLGVPNTSTWIDKERTGNHVDPSEPTKRAELLNANMIDIERASAVVFLAHVGNPRAGHWDTCWALARNKRVFWTVDGDRGMNLWTAHPNVTIITRAINTTQLATKLASAIRRELGGTKARVA